MRNISRFIVAVVIIFLFANCGEEKRNNIYYNDVYFQVNVRVQDNALNAVGNYKTFDKPRLARDRIGFGGLLVVCSASLVEGTTMYHLYAYDLACPYEQLRHVKVVPNKDGTATCPECNSVYALLGGYVKSGPSDTNLQTYSAYPQHSDPGVFLITR